MGNYFGPKGNKKCEISLKTYSDTAIVPKDRTGRRSEDSLVEEGEEENQKHFEQEGNCQKKEIALL